MIKSSTTYTEQIEKLKSRGCVILNEANCKEALSNINYYRLSAYFLPFKNKDGSYKPNTIFENVLQIYNFDRQLRTILFGAIEVLEIFLRARFSYFHAHKYGALGYLDKSNYKPLHNHADFQKLITTEIYQNRKVSFVKHHQEKYKGQFPIWVIIEIFSFGNLSYFYTDMNSQDKKELAHTIWNSIPTDISSWL